MASLRVFTSEGMTSRHRSQVVDEVALGRSSRRQPHDPPVRLRMRIEYPNGDGHFGEED